MLDPGWIPGVRAPRLHPTVRASAPIILANIRKAGFRVEDVRILLCTHAHLDHAGGLARIKAATGGRVVIGADDADLLARGGRGDFAYGDTLLFPPVQADVRVRNGQEVELGGVRFKAVATPGHTRGCTTWTFAIKDGAAVRRVVVIGGTSAPDYRLVDNVAYPSIAADFEATFARLRTLAADMAFEGHGLTFDLEARRQGKLPFVDPQLPGRAVARAEKAFGAQVQARKDKGEAPR